MIFKIMMFIVFIAEIIITFTILRSLIKLDKYLLKFDELVEIAKPSIQDISELTKKISGQMVILANDLSDKIKKKNEDITLKWLNKILLGLIFLKINSKTLNKLRKSKFMKRIGMGFAILESMV